MIILSKLFNGEFVLLSVMGLLGLIVLVCQEKKCKLLVIFSVLFLLAWRFLFAQKINFASRYVFSINYLLIFTAVYFVDVLARCFKIKKILFVVVLCVLVAYQSVKTFCSYRNIYICWMKDSIVHLTRIKPEISYAIDEKEFERLKINCQRNIVIDFPPSDKFIKTFLMSYTTWGHDLCLITKSSRDFLAVAKQCEPFLELKPYSKFITGKTMRNISMIIYNSKKDQVDLELAAQIRNKDGNKIRNGDFENPASDQDTKKEFKKWIDCGALFYSLNNILLPQSIYLLPTNWSLKNGKTYPIVFLDDNQAIGGKYSLHIIFNELEAYYPVWFLHRIDSESGILSFNVKSLDGNSVLRLARTDFQKDGKWFDSPQEYNILLTDTDIHHYLVYINKDEYLAPLTMFRFLIKNSNVILDDIQFIPTL